jgi:hypothetical protein
MDMLRCKSSELVQKEIAVFLLAYNLIRASIARTATVKRKIPRHISFMTAVQLLNEGISQLMLLSGKKLKHVVDGLLGAIASFYRSDEMKTTTSCYKTSTKTLSIIGNASKTSL